MTSFDVKVSISDEFSRSETLEILQSEKLLMKYFKSPKVGGATVELSLGGFPGIEKEDLKKISGRDFETNAAIELHDALIPIRASHPELLIDPKFWSWVALVPMREYVLGRWCKAAGLFGSPLPADLETGYFFTKRGDLKGHTRSGPRRLYIAARAAQLADGNFDNLSKFFADTDLYTGIFERRMSLDAETAVELAVSLENSTRAERRFVLRSVQLMLSTVALEYLDRSQKKKIIELAQSDFQANAKP